MTSFVAAAVLAAVALSGCASFADTSPAFSVAASLAPQVATVLPATPELFPAPSTPPREPSSAATRPSRPGAEPSTTPPRTPSAAKPPSPSAPTTSPSTTTGSTPATPDDAACAPPDLPVVAVCLDHPWGLVPLPGGRSALVGERVTGKIFRITAGQEPDLITTVTGLDASNGGLLGLARSPYYAEDRLAYAYVATPDDARIVRIAPGQAPQAIITGLPIGAVSGGPLAFGSDGLLYVATGGSVKNPAGEAASGATDEAASGRHPLAHAVLRFDAFGNPAAGNASGSAVFATGLRDPTGICMLPSGGMVVVDHRAGADVLITVTDGGDYTTLTSGETLWQFRAGDGGASDCAVSNNALLATSRKGPGLTRIRMLAAGGFVGTPEHLVPEGFGRLRTITTGPGDIPWLTTANIGASAAAPGSDVSPNDDRVFLLPAGGGGSEEGGLD